MKKLKKSKLEFIKLEVVALTSKNMSVIRGGVSDPNNTDDPMTTTGTKDGTAPSSGKC